MTSSIQVSEEMIAAGFRVLGAEPEIDAEDLEAIYLAMRSKDHSIAVDDVERVDAALLGLRKGPSERDWNSAILEARHAARAALVRSKLPIDRGELLALLELGGDYAADVLNDFPNKSSPCALRVAANLERFNKAHAAITAIGSQSIEGECRDQWHKNDAPGRCPKCGMKV